MSGPAPGIGEVARVSGFSSTTVSNALSGKGRVAPATRERILAVAHDLGYRPHAAAAHLARKRTGHLILTSSPSDPSPVGLMDVDYFLAFALSGSTAALQAGYALMLGPAADQERLWAELRFEGALVTDPLPDDPFLDWLEERRIPVVTVGRDVGRSGAAWWVDSDVRAVTAELLDHLTAVGARRIGLVCEPPHHSFSVDQHAAYREWQAARGGEPLIEETVGNRTEAGFHATLRMLDRPDPPDAILASLEGLALGVKLAAESRGVDVPGRLKVASTSDGTGLATAETAITAFDLAPGEAAAVAVGMLVDRIEGRSPEPRTVFVPPTLRVRGSTVRA